MQQHPSPTTMITGPRHARSALDFPYLCGAFDPKASNELYLKNLAKGRTGLSIAFDLPTQTGYDYRSSAGARRGWQGGGAGRSFGRYESASKDIPLDKMNTSMTINATAAWLLSLYIAAADEQGAPRSALAAHSERHHQGISFARHLRVSAAALDAADQGHRGLHVPRSAEVEPHNVCSYHLQEAGATPVQELTYALAIAQAVLDTVKDSGEVSPAEFGEAVARISFFVNAGVRFITEMCKMRAFVGLWDEITDERYGVTDPKAPPVPLWRPGQFARPNRAAAGKQPLPHSARDARGGAVEGCAGAGRAIAGLERSAWLAAPVGSAMDLAHAADRRL